MRKLLGFACHRASVRLHGAAVHSLPVGWSCQPQLYNAIGGAPMTLSDVAPRLADALDMARRNLERMRTMVGGRKGL